MNTTASQPESGERITVLMLCLLGAVHVLFFSAAFPFFSVVDEQAHFDLVLRYAQFDPPRMLPHTNKAALPYIVYFSTPEYLSIPAEQPGGVFAPPPWKVSPEDMARRLAPHEKFWRETVLNHEASQPPLYYIFAGGWWRIGQAMGLEDGPLLYWLRFMNALLLAALVWLAAVTARKLFPENLFIRMTVPALAALFPQSIFYAVNNDILSPLGFGAAFLLLLTFWETEAPGPRLAALTGLALAATFLTKISNLPLLAVAIGFLALKMFLLWWNDRLRVTLVPMLVLLLCAALPMAAWLAWCRINFGDLTGTAQKMQFLNWTDKPITEWLHHPLFTAQGFWFFLKTNLATFWQGEQLWLRQPLANPAVDSAYVVLTLGALGLALAALLRPSSGFTTSQRTAVTLSFLCFAAMLAFFALLSVKYDFQDCFYPSRPRPYFVSGRLLLGMLIPFLILFAAGLDRLMKNFQAPTKFFALVILLGFMLASEIASDWPVIASEYNWFHL